MKAPRPYADIPELPVPDGVEPRSRPKPFDTYGRMLPLHQALGSIFKLRPPGLGYCMTYVTDPAAIRHVLEDPEDEFEKGPSTLFPFSSLVPLHLAVLEGPRHAFCRRACVKGLSPSRLEHYAFPAALRHGKRFVANLGSALARDDAIEDIDRRCRAFALDVISELVFGESWLAQADYTKEGNPKAWALGQLMYVLHWRIVDFTDVAWRADGYDGEARELRRILETYVVEEIARHRRLLEADAASDDILTMLLNYRAPGPSGVDSKLSDEEVASLCLTFLTMGHENVGSAMAWTLIMLAEHPEVQREVRAEVLALVPGGTQNLTFDALQERTPLLTRAFEETIRLCPSVPSVTRMPRNPEGAVVMGYHFPQGAEIALNLHAHHRLEPELGGVSGAEPMAFCPGRSVESGNRGPIPFAAGARQCIGRPLAYMEARLAVAAVLAEYNLSAENLSNRPGDPKTRMAVHVSLRPWESRILLSRTPSKL